MPTSIPPSTTAPFGTRPALATAPRTRSETRKASFNLPIEDLEALKALAARRNTTATQVIRQALATELFIQSLVDRGRRLFSREGRRYEEHHFVHMG